MMWREMGWTPVAGCYMSKSGAKKEPEGGGAGWPVPRCGLLERRPRAGFAYIR